VGGRPYEMVVVVVLLGDGVYQGCGVRLVCTKSTNRNPGAFRVFSLICVWGMGVCGCVNSVAFLESQPLKRGGALSCFSF